MRTYDLVALKEDYLAKKILRGNFKDGLLVCCYNEVTRHKKQWDWDSVTRTCRGIVIEEATGKVVAHCLPKFFNYKEAPETTNLPNEPYTVTDKLDGSLIHCFMYQGKTYHTTKASFNTIYSDYARRLLPELKVDDEYTTLVCELRIPDDMELMARVTRRDPGLYLITAFNSLGQEYDRPYVEYLADKYSINTVPIVDITLEELISKPTIKDTEGWVVRFDGGLRVKFKTSWYLTLNRVLEEIDTPTKLREYVRQALKNHGGASDWVNNMPEEFQGVLKVEVGQLKSRYNGIKREVEDILNQHQGASRKEIALAITDHPLKHIIFTAIDGRLDTNALWDKV